MIAGAYRGRLTGFAGRSPATVAALIRYGVPAKRIFDNQQRAIKVCWPRDTLVALRLDGISVKTLVGLRASGVKLVALAGRVVK